jgi:hypothetical protein
MPDKIVSVNSITSKEDLAAYIESLKIDLVNNPSNWENITLERYLDAMAAWVQAMDNYSRNSGISTVATPSWATFAEILTAAKMYE